MSWPPPILCGIKYGFMSLLHEIPPPTDTNRLDPRGVKELNFSRVGAYLAVVAQSSRSGSGQR